MIQSRFSRSFALGGLISALSSPAFAQTAPDLQAQPTEPTQTPAEAETEDPTLARAREAFMLGTALAREGQWLDALAAFERSAGLRSHPVTTYNLAYCERALGRYTRARQLFKLALGDHAAKKGGTLTDELVAQANSYVAEIERRVARATVTVSPAGATLTVDGRGLEVTQSSSGPSVYVAGTSEATGPAPAPTGAFELLLDPGRHIFVLGRPGLPDKVVTETFKAGERRRIDLSADGGDAAPPPALASSPARGKDYTWPIVAYGVGAAGLTIGTIFGIATFNKKSDLEEECPNKQCSDSENKDAAERYALVSNIGFGVGIVGVGLGTFLLFSSSDKESDEPLPKASAKVALRAWISPTSAGLRGTF